MKMLDYVVDRGGTVALATIEKPAADFKSASDVFERTLAHEQRVTSLIHNLYAQASKESDYASMEMLQWFIKEQVEEEKNASLILDQLKMVGRQGLPAWSCSTIASASAASSHGSAWWTIPTTCPRKSRRSPNEKNYITPAGYRKLVDELEFLHTSKRPEVVSALADAAAEGDRSENAEYIYRKRQCARSTRACASFPSGLTMSSSWTRKNRKRRDRVFFETTVTVEDEDEVTLVYRIVGQDEVEGSEG